MAQDGVSAKSLSGQGAGQEKNTGIKAQTNKKLLRAKL